MKLAARMEPCVDRRQFLAVSAVGGAASTLPAPALQAAGNNARSVNPSSVNPGIDRDRARQIMQAAGRDALVLGRPENIFYATGRWPFLPRIGLNDATFAIIPAELGAPIILIQPQFPYYYTAADAGLSAGVEPWLVTYPDGSQAGGAFYFAPSTDATLSKREVHRRTVTDATMPFHSSTPAALAKVLSKLGVQADRLGHDCAEAHLLLGQSTAAAQSADCTDVIKSIRLIKTPFEIDLMRAASRANVTAARKAAEKIRQLGTIKNLRNYFNAEVSRLGNQPGFMVINGAVDEAYDEEFVSGTSVLIDCVSCFNGYHGDYGRTIFIGEPRQPMKTKVQAMGLAWNELRGQLKPGMRFSDIQAQGKAILSKLGHNLNVPFGPHCVGLAHTEQPMMDRNGKPIDTFLQAGMIISVDCPLMEASILGTAHLEDLTLITADGHAPIHDISNDMLAV